MYNKVSTDNNMTDTLDEIYEYSMLYDFYGALLKDKNIKVFEDYVFNDMSLSEIAAEQGMTRQGVRDIVVRCKGRLAEYERKLGLVNSFNEMKDKISDIKTETKVMREEIDRLHSLDKTGIDEKTYTQLSEYFTKMENISSEIAENL